jgi:hypothetical protein
VSPAKFPLHGYVGAAGIVVAEVLLFSGNVFVGHWFTPIVWTAYILLTDALVYRVKGRSLLKNDRLEFLVVVIISIASWWLFELYNAPRFWNSNLELWWHYHNLEPNLWIRRIGYDWAFATITPALLETADLFRATVFRRERNALTVRMSKPLLAVMILIGAAGVVVPLVRPSEWFAPIIWLSFIIFIDPFNTFNGSESIVGDLARGDWRRLFSLLASGLVCGFLWEFWNYWALSKWTYTVPYFGDIKMFEMPVVGYLGFPPFAVECWVIYIFLHSLLQPLRHMQGSDIFLRSS